MRKHKFKSDRTFIETMHLFTFIRPIFKYCDVVWHNCFNYMKKINERKKQIKAARIAIGATKLVSFNAIYKKLYTKEGKITSQHFFYKISNYLTLHYLSFLSLLVLSSVITYGHLMIRHSKQERVCIIILPYQMQLEDEIAYLGMCNPVICKLF